jgi:hypothetical protein
MDYGTYTGRCPLLHHKQCEGERSAIPADIGIASMLVIAVFALEKPLELCNAVFQLT